MKICDATCPSDRDTGKKEIRRAEENREEKQEEGLDLDEKEDRALGSLEEAVTGRVVHPGIIIRTAHASLKVDGLAGHLFGGQFAGMRHPTRLRALYSALLPPRLEILRLGDGARVLNPLNHLGHRHEVDVVVTLQNLVDPVKEGVQKFRIVLQPGSVEVEAERRAILLVVTIEIVIEEVVELVTGQDVAARIHHGAAGQVLVVLRILAPVQFVHHHLPHSVRSLKHYLKNILVTIYIFI